MLTRDRSTSPRFAASAIRPSSRASKTPASRHCRKRLWTVDQAPNSVGISRHWPPALNRQITPSNCCRSRSGYGPYSPIGRYGSMNSHSGSVSCTRVTYDGLPDQTVPRRHIPQIDHDSIRSLSGLGACGTHARGGLLRLLERQNVVLPEVRGLEGVRRRRRRCRSGAAGLPGGGGEQRRQIDERSLFRYRSRKGPGVP